MAFRVVHMNKVLSKGLSWATRVDFREVLECAKRVQERIQKGDWMEVQVTRVWIDNGKRPLGVPTLADRVIGSMLSNLLEFYMWNTIQNNHAYQAGKGSGTAWKKLLSYSIRFPWIWEFDLDGCFNRLSHEAIVAVLRSIGLPS